MIADTTKRRFTEEFRREAVALWETSGRTQTEVSAGSGIMLTMLRRWQRRLEDTGRKPGGEATKKFMARSTAPCPSASFVSTMQVWAASGGREVSISAWRVVRERLVADGRVRCDHPAMRNALPRPLDLTRIRAIVKEYRALIGAPDAPLFGSPQGDGSPYVVVANVYRFLVEERGVELERRETDDLDELLYWIFDGITFALASRFERRNRRPDEDPRRLLFATQDEALGRISAQWRERKRIEREPILIRSPFNDDRR